MQKKDITSIKYSMLTVLQEVDALNGKKRYLCKCDCGAVIEKSYSNLTNPKNINQSCGCMSKVWQAKAKTTHGGRYTRLYRIWGGILARCINSGRFVDTPNHSTYKDKAILICSEWKNNFEAFEKWALSNRYNDTLTIDRIDNNGHYSPSNCQWISKSLNSSKDSVGVSNFKCRKLTDSDVIVIRKYLDEGNLPQIKIAELFNVERTTISRIKRGTLCY